MLRKGRDMVPEPRGRERIELSQADKVDEDLTVSTE
jgi:hypothetical protein